ncbi:formin-E-like [Helicoverpa zea]|uniref:formin-E-like n=1 Tax=Helicoverpa zea TaxID=7113 RepID=UPI001F57D500|nr:formin-E-like [Helicoverpa zea]XP_047029490.1 formin-E-like [Helicoverpa zea]XP_047035417.1 formin-E-like [Helicoverpa zea]XP_047035418.1 formin-E-like [Helicoverpa zea]
MGKRSRSRTEHDYESLAKKVKSLEKLLRARKDRQHVTRHRLSSTSSSSSCTSCSSSDSSAGSGRSPAARPHAYQDLFCIEGAPAIEPEPSTSAAPHVAPPYPPPQRTTPPSPAVPPPPPPPGPAVADTVESPPAPATVDANIYVTGTEPAPPDSQVTPQINDEIMQLLGEDPSQKRVYGNDIQPDLAVRLQHVATSGLSKEARKELLDKYLVPANCTLIDAPLLNPEVKVAIPETVHKRDKGIENKQKQIASAITCIAQALTLLISSEQTASSTELIRLLMDAQKILCDSQNSDSLVRRNFILFVMKKELKDQLQATKIDNFLFSAQLADTLKAAKAINKTGGDMKPAPPKQPAKKVTNPNVQKHHLNWRAPPQSHRSKGTQRRKEPAPRNRHEPSSKQSSRPATSRGRR